MTKLNFKIIGGCISLKKSPSQFSKTISFKTSGVDKSTGVIHGGIATLFDHDDLCYVPKNLKIKLSSSCSVKDDKSTLAMLKAHEFYEKQGFDVFWLDII